MVDFPASTWPINTMLTFSLSSSALCGAAIVLDLGSRVALGEDWSTDCSFAFNSFSLTLVTVLWLSSVLTVTLAPDDESSTSFWLLGEEVGSLEGALGMVVLLLVVITGWLSCIGTADGSVSVVTAGVVLGSSAAMSSHDSTSSPPPNGD